MALASGQWVDKEIKGHPPSPRYGHALAVAGNIAFLFGGVSTLNSPDGQPKYHNDFYILTVSPSDVSWEVMPQNGQIPPAREGHSLCLIKSKLYLFGGSSFSQAEECLPGVYSFDIGTLTWEKLKTSGRAVQSLKHSSDVVGENIYVFGGILKGNACDDLLVFNTVALTWTPVKTTGSVPSARFNHTTALLGEQIYMFGGSSAEDSYYKDIYILDTGTLAWQKCEVKGDSPSGSVSQTFTAHSDKDIYLFGGRCESKNGTTTNEIQKLSIAKMKWKVPLYVGIPPARRHGHAAFILHSHIYIIGGANEEQEFNDVKVMKLINPSERQPIMKEILSEFGIQGVSNGFAPTKVPKVKYELTESPFPARIDSPPPIQVAHHRDFNTVRNEAMEMVTRAFAIVDNAFQKLDNEKSELFQATIAFQYEKEAYNTQRQKQQQELKEMLEKHKTQNEAWLKARAEENDKEKNSVNSGRKYYMNKRN